MKCFDAKYNCLPKAELHCHLEGAIRTATIIDIAREYGLELPAYDVAGLDPHVKVYDQLKDLGAVLDAFGIARNSIASPAVVERIAGELFEDANAQNIKLLEVRFSPDWAFSGHGLDWDDALGRDSAGQTARRRPVRHGHWPDRHHVPQLGTGSCEKTVDWAIRWKDHLHGVDLADGEEEYPIKDFVRPDAESEGGRAQSDRPFRRRHACLRRGRYDPRRQPRPDRARHAYH